MNLTQQQIASMNAEQFAQFVEHIKAASDSNAANNSRAPAPQKNARDMTPAEWQTEKRRLGLR